MKRLFAVLLLGLAACPVWAEDHKMMPQSGCTGYSGNTPQYSLFMPSDWAAQGNITATISGLVSNASGGYPSHNLTVTGNANASLATQITISWNSSGGSTAVLSTTLNGAPYGQPQNVALNGSMGFIAYSPWDGNTIGWQITVTGASGNSTQDRIAVAVVPGTTPTIVSQDEISTNLYQQGQFSFSVPPMNQACQQCIDYPSSCLGANHTPYITARLKNINTGETKSISHGVAGNDFSESEYGYGSWTAGISVLPGDGPEPDPTDPTIGEIFCFAVGADIFNQQNPTSGYTYKTMKTKIKVLQRGSVNPDGSVRWYVETWCKDTQHEPIWQPLYIDTKGAATIETSVGQYDMSYAECWAEPGWPAWKCPPMTVTPPQPLTIGVGGTKYDCSTLINTPLPK